MSTCLNPAPGRCRADIQNHRQIITQVDNTLTLWSWNSIHQTTLCECGSTLSTLPSAETVRPGFLKSGRPSLSQVRVGGGIASLWQWSSTGWPSITVAFTSSPLMFGGTVADVKTSWRFCHLISNLKRGDVQFKTLKTYFFLHQLTLKVSSLSHSNAAHRYKCFLGRWRSG